MSRVPSAKKRNSKNKSASDATAQLQKERISAKPSAGRRVWLAWTTLVLALAVVGSVAGYFAYWQPQPRPKHSRTTTTKSSDRDTPTDASHALTQASHALSQRDFARAEELARQVLESNPTSTAALLVAAQACVQLGKMQAAIEFCDRVPQNATADAEVAAWVPCELLFRDGQLSTAITRLEQLVEKFPQHAEARHRIVDILSLCGRRWESQLHLLKLLQLGAVERSTLERLAETARVFDTASQLNEFAAQHPQDPLPRLGLARLDLVTNRNLPETILRLEEITQSNPLLGEAWARLGEALLKRSAMLSNGDALAAFLHWAATVPENVQWHPEVWVVRANYAQQTGQMEASARCYWEAVRRDPNHLAALYQLGQVLQSLDRTSDATLILDRHRRLTELVRAVDSMAGKGLDPEFVNQAARLTKECGRLWEAWGWYSLARSTAPNDLFAGQQQAILASQLNRDHPAQTIAAEQPAVQVDLSSLPLPDYDLDGTATSDALANDPTSNEDNPSPTNSDSSLIQFEDQAVVTGMEFEYFSSPTAGAEGKHIYEFGGGGVAVLDMDLNGWPDVYFTQGCRWPYESSSSEYRNELFRNLGQGNFQLVSAAKGPADNGFGQGASVGDYNSDGFPDVYVANIGPNRLYINNGDGTFSDASALMDQATDQWTTSCLIADLNGDGQPDLYDVNYLQGEDIFTRICTWPEGKLRICGPATYQSAQDQLLINSGTTGFTNITAQAGIDIPSGNGLGVVAGILDLSTDSGGVLQWFVANDQQPNYLFRIEQVASGQATLSESAVPMGLAYDAQGAAQACMGVAAGDANEDGSLDLFVTNYYQESNALYEQQLPGLFSDQSRQSQLQSPSYLMLGFGTQFLDADLDGWLDLVLTNGHLDDFSYLGQPYQMRPQFFRNESHAKFAELTSAQLGPFFAQPALGRSLARIDWNRDGREDFIVSHLDKPAALLTNLTQSHGNYIAFELRGVTSSRDAIGAIVTIQTQSGRTLTRQLTAGDGYQASNERQLVFGFSLSDVIESTMIRWPAGTSQEVLGPLTLNRHYLWIEGASNPTELPAN